MAYAIGAKYTTHYSTLNNDKPLIIFDYRIDCNNFVKYLWLLFSKTFLPCIFSPLLTLDIGLK